MGWGLDAHWSAAAAAAGLARSAIVDATPVRHLRPIAATYPRAAAEAGGGALPREPALRDPRARPPRRCRRWTAL